VIRIRSLLIVIFAAASAATAAGAQGTLSTQGFGYPQGEFSTRALATGGALSQFDPQSGVNPASISMAGDPLLFLQYEPEFRKVTSGSLSSNSTTARFPMLVASVPISGQYTLGVSVSTFLDRSWSTSATRVQDVAGEPASVTENVKSLGAIDDIRVIAGWVPSSRVQLGVAAHVYTGQNRLFFQQTFPDSLHFVPVQQVSNLDYTGVAVSAGAIFHPSSIFEVAISGRKGGNFNARTGDTIVSQAKIPDRYGAAISYGGLTGATISAQVGRDRWSALNGLGSTDARAVDAWDSGLGIEAIGPRVLSQNILLRLGARYRTLPFVAAGSEVHELSFAGGFGAQFARNRAAFDVTLQRASRTTDAAATAVRERAFTLSFGLRVRP
jgi:hypothetical protein